MAHFSVALVGKPSCVWVRPCMPGTLCHCTPSGLAASCGVGTIVSNDLLSVRAQTPVTRFSMRLLTRAGRPVGGDPIYRRLFCKARKFHGPPPPAPRSRGDSAPQYCLCFFEDRPLR